MTSVGWQAFEIAVNAFQACLYLYFFKCRLSFPRRTPVADALCALSYTLFLTAYLFWDIPIPDTVGGAIFLVYLLCASDSRWPECAFWVLFKEALTVATVGAMLQLCLSAFSVPYALVMSPSKYRVVFVLSTNFVLFIEIFIFSKVKRESTRLHRLPLLLFSAMNVALLTVIEILFSLQIQARYPSDLPFFLAYAALMLGGILSVGLFHVMTSVAARERQAQIALHHAQLTKERQLAIQDMYEDMRRQRHDMRQHIQTLEQLIARQGTAAAKRYLEKYEAQGPVREAFLTGSIAVDALLTAKSLACARRGIDLKVSACPLGSLPVCEIDFCAVVGNLLDNAIEGNDRMASADTPRYVHLYFSRVYDMFIIRCENPANLSTIRRAGGRFETSKQDASIHGFGIPNVIAIAERAQGFCAFDVEGSEFVATVTLPYPTEEGEQRREGRTV